jgi:hypothetical protein
MRPLRLFTPSVLQLACRDSGTRANHIQLSVPGLATQEGEYYLFSFRARASRPFAPALVSLVKNSPPWTAYGARETTLPTIGTTWTNHTIRFYARQMADDARLTFFLGGVMSEDTTLWVRPERLTKVRCNQPFPLSVDVGNIIFDQGKTTGVKKWGEADLCQDGDYFYDARSRQVKSFSSTTLAWQRNLALQCLRRSFTNNATTHANSATGQRPTLNSPQPSPTPQGQNPQEREDCVHTHS